MWLRCRPAAAAQIHPLACERPYAADVALKREKRKEIKSTPGVPVLAQWLANLTRNHEVAGLVPALAQWVNVAVSCGVGCRLSLDPALLWLWRRPGATAPI